MKEPSFRGLTNGTGSPAPVKLVEGLVLLHHATCVTLLEVWATVSRVRWSGWHQGASEPWMIAGWPMLGVLVVGTAASLSGYQAVAKLGPPLVWSSGIC